MDAVTAVAKEVLGPTARIHQDWFDENSKSIQAALNAKNKAFTEQQNNPTSVTKKNKFKKLQTRVQSELQEMQDQWWQDKTEKVQSYADSNNAKNLFSSLRTVHDLDQRPGRIRECWAEHFSRPSIVDPEALNQISQQPVRQELDLPPFIDKIKRSILQTNSSRASGKDGIPV